METNFKPLHNYVLVFMDFKESESGLVLTTDIKKKEKMFDIVVEAIGPDVTKVKVGDKVHILAQSIPTVASKGRECGIVREFDIVGTFE